MTPSDVSPAFPPLYATDLLLDDPITSSEFTLIDHAAQGTDLQNLTISQFTVGYVLAAFNFLQPHAKRMKMIARASRPFEVVGRIVILDAVDVVHTLRVGRFMAKGLSHETMHGDTSMNTVLAKCHLNVPRRFLIVVKNSLAVETTHKTKSRNFIESFVAKYRRPVMHTHSRSLPWQRA